MHNTETNFNAQDIERLKQALRRSYKERFEVATQIYKMQKFVENRVVISHKPSLKKH